MRGRDDVDTPDVIRVCFPSLDLPYLQLTLVLLFPTFFNELLRDKGWESVRTEYDILV